MEEMSPAVTVPFRVGNSVCDNPNIATHMDVTRLKLMTDTAGLLSDSVTRGSSETVAAGEKDCNCSYLENEVSFVEVSVPKEDEEGEAPLLDMISQDGSNWVSAADVIARESEEDDSLSLEGDQILDSSCSLSVASESSSLCLEDFLVYEASPDIGTLTSVDVEKSICCVDVTKASDLGDSKVQTEITTDPLAMTVSLEEENRDGSDPKPSEVVQLPVETGVKETVSRSVFEVDYVPLWGFTSMIGRRPEMEDALATVPQLLKIPIQMLIGDRVLDGMSKCLNQTVHFFGVYDGHGGSQVPFHISYLFLVHSFPTAYHAFNVFLPVTVFRGVGFQFV